MLLTKILCFPMTLHIGLCVPGGWSIIVPTRTGHIQRPIIRKWRFSKHRKAVGWQNKEKRHPRGPSFWVAVGIGGNEKFKQTSAGEWWGGPKGGRGGGGSDQRHPIVSTSSVRMSSSIACLVH